MASLAVSSIDSQIDQLNVKRASEGDIVLNSSDIEILGSYSESGNPEKRLILLITLKTPYIDFLGNVKYKIPFYMSSGHYSKGYKGTFQPFLGIFAADTDKKNIYKALKYLENLLEISPNHALTNNEIFKEFLGKYEPTGTNYKLFTSPNFIKCIFIHVFKKLFNSEQLKRIINNQTIFSNEYSKIKDANQKLCNPYFEKYSNALGAYFSKNKIDLDSINNVTIEEINQLISINTVFGINLSNIPTLDMHFSDVMNKIDEYNEIYRLLRDDLQNNTTVDFHDTRIFKNSSWIENTFEYLTEGKIFPKKTDILHFYNSYYDKSHEDHERVLEMIKYNFSQLHSEEREV